MIEQVSKRPATRPWQHLTCCHSWHSPGTRKRRFPRKSSRSHHAGGYVFPLRCMLPWRHPLLATGLCHNCTHTHRISDQQLLHKNKTEHTVEPLSWNHHKNQTYMVILVFVCVCVCVCMCVCVNGLLYMKLWRKFLNDKRGLVSHSGVHSIHETLTLPEISPRSTVWHSSDRLHSAYHERTTVGKSNHNGAL